jgi:DNA/RNA endonuclease YhcR with UshA esterase domain
MYAGSGVKLGDFKISGVVISDATNKNISRSTIVLQDGNAGISIFIPSSNAPYNIGDSIEIDVSKDSLIKYNGQMEIKKSSNEVWPDAIATGITILPKELTIKQLVDSLPYLEFTLVKIKDASITGEGTFSGNKTLSDASGSITLYTSSAATFAGSALPSGTHDWIGYATYYKATKEFIIRNLEDIQ